ncbi:uncharacterized protein MELLADRAFT_85254 [Melampsora larici-populina 98AG31]|uniref:AB hydrolase-1 domain-containing protein n=1 Tax=Melampsora larici-populina (strain 98AG31 / pathotype 3-4-7) TaxID=747676 RepID=F4RI31_MELLP|nr:uncharacterized protein MELLADRAFT_85254 [Melampsora larici-populina 98AG31]EGG07928.1 hypothetical protein MELLADRAFT_85254 [Melampsora larici-populina 98AG31]
MSFLFKLPDLFGDVLVLSSKSIVPVCWSYVIFRLVLLGYPLDILPFLAQALRIPLAVPLALRIINAFETYPRRPLATDPWFIAGSIEVIFSLYQCYLYKRIQAYVPGERHSREFLRELIKRINGVGLRGGLPTIAPEATPTVKYRKFTKETSLLNPHYAEEPQEPGKLVPPSVHFPETPLSSHDPEAISFREYQSLWFEGAHWSEIYHDNYLEWLAGATCNMSLQEVADDDRKSAAMGVEPNELRMPFLKELVSYFEHRAGRQFPPGYNVKLKNKVIKSSIDPIKTKIRPLLFYMLAYATGEATRSMTYLNGFRHERCVGQKFRYLIRIPEGWASQPVERREKPVIFVHGVGFGLIQYISLVAYLTYSSYGRERPVVILLQPSISMEIFDKSFLDPPCQAEVARDVEEIMEKWKFKETGIDLLSHSNGTVIAGWVIKAFPQLVNKCCFIDPICFVDDGLSDALNLTSLPQPDAFRQGALHLLQRFLIHFQNSFLYSKPRTGIENVMRYSLATEIGIAKYTHSHLDWCAAVLWPHETPGFLDPKRFLVVLSGRDPIVNAERVRKYLLSEGMKDAFPADNASQKGAVQGVTKDEAEKNGFGGILTDWEAGHGQTFMPDSPYFPIIKNWLEGKGCKS